MAVEHNRGPVMSHLVPEISFDEFIDQHEGRASRKKGWNLADSIRNFVNSLKPDFSHHSRESVRDVFVEIPNEPSVRSSQSMSLQRSSQ